jgi:hypothetical protein
VCRRAGERFREELDGIEPAFDWPAFKALLTPIMLRRGAL